MRSAVVECRKINAPRGTHFSVAVTNSVAALMADCSVMYRPQKPDLEADGAREVAVVHLHCADCYHAHLTVLDVAVTASSVLDNAPNQSQALLELLSGGEVLLVLTSISCFVTVTGAVHNAVVQVSRCSLDADVNQTSARPLAFLSHACITSAVFFISSVAMNSLTLRVVNCTLTRRTSVAVRLLTDVESAVMLL